MCYDSAQNLDPGYANAHFNEGLVRLLLGDLATGFQKYNWFWIIHKESYNFPAQEWKGERLDNKTLLVCCDHGAGDIIQFSRYTGALSALGARVYLLCPDNLRRLLRSLDGVQEVFIHEAAPTEYHYYTHLLKLPSLLGTTLDTIPAVVPYLRPDQLMVRKWKELLTRYPGFKVGVVWRGNPKHENDHNRSMTAEQFAKIVDIPSVTTVVLQKEASRGEVLALDHGQPILNVAQQLTDFSDTAAIIANLDLVISVDTSVCHLAGALGIPVWTLVPFMPDWRWMLNRSDSPWYPTMCLFRQPSAGDWDSVIKDVTNKLAVNASMVA